VVGGRRHHTADGQLVREQKRKNHVVKLNGGWQRGKWLLVIVIFIFLFPRRLRFDASITEQ
jgi:hypothetical protein